MDSALAHAGAPVPFSFTDGLGVRRRTQDPARHEPIELLCLRTELTSVPSFEFALRERVSHLASFRHACYAGVRSVERLKNQPSALVLVSDVTAGVRLSDVLTFAEQSNVPLDIDAALCLLRQIVPAVAMLHEHAPDVAHGAIGPERIVVTPNARIVMVEHVLGAALSELQFSRERYWTELRVALPGTTAPVTFSQRSDVTQLGVVALSLILGRTLADDEPPSTLGEVVASSWAISARGGLEPLPAGLRAWLMRALQLDPRESFESAVDAHEELERVLGDSDYMAAPSTLEAFLSHYRAAADATTSEREQAAEPAPLSMPTLASSIKLPDRSVEPVRPIAKAPEPAQAPVALPPRPADNVWGMERGAEPPHHAETPAPPLAAPLLTAMAHAPKPLVRSVEPVRHADPPPSSASVVLPKRVDPPSPASDESDLRRGTAQRDERDSGRHVDAYAPRYVAPPLDLAPQTHDVPAGKTSGRKIWVAAAAVAVIAAAGVSVPAARRFVMPGAAVTEGTLVINTNPPGAKLFVDGVERGATPLSLPLKPGPHSLEVRGDGAPRLMPITITAGAQVSQYLEMPKVAAAVGQLLVRTEPAGARVSVDGVGRGASPVTVSELTPGEHAVQLESDFGVVKQVVTIEAGNTASLMVPLGAPEGAPVSGWIALSAPADVQLFENKRLIGTSQSERLMVSAGRHEIEIINEALGYRAVRTIQVAPGKVTPVRVEFPKGAIALNALPWAEVWVDGEKVGETPIGNLQLTIGTHDILFRHPDLGEQRHKATISLTAPARLSVDLRKK
jgi:serine/threonine protein kinase